MSVSEDFLYDLLPPFVRNRDFYQGQPLRALMEVLGGEYATLDEDLRALYHDWFIETCDGWVVPYIGNLIGIEERTAARERFRDLRSLVANSIAYRRHKGIPAVLGRVAQDATGWPTLAVPSAPRLVRAQSLGRLHPGQGGSAAVRDAAALSRLGGPFGAVARTVDVRRHNLRRHQILVADDPTAGLNLPSMALYVWRLGVFPLERVAPHVEGEGIFRFHPLGADTPLFNPPRPPAELTESPEARNLPVELTPEMVRADVEALRQDQPPPYGLFGPRPAFEILLGGRAIAPAAIEVVDLESWRRPPADASYVQTLPGGGRERRPVEVAVDPRRGRFALRERQAPAEAVEVAFSYGLAADLGGGAYERDAPPSSSRAPWRAWVGSAAAVAGASPAPGERLYADLESALAAWREDGRGDAVVRLAPGVRHRLAAPVELAGARLELVGAAGGAVLEGKVPARDDQPPGGVLRLENLWIDGALELSGVSLELAHSTVKTPSVQGAAVSLSLSGTPGVTLRVEISSSLLGPVRPRRGLFELRILDSVVEGGAGTKAVAPGPGGRLAASIARTTFFGGVELEALHAASDAIFDGPVEVTYPDRGGVRYSYVPPGSHTPRRHRCQPDLALAQAPDKQARELVALRLRPIFTSRRHGDPGYAQLAASCPREIRIGAESGAEMGVFERLQQPQREAALELAAEDYVPYGMEARVIYVD